MHVRRTGCSRRTRNALLHVCARLAVLPTPANGLQRKHTRAEQRGGGSRHIEGRERRDSREGNADSRCSSSVELVAAARGPNSIKEEHINTNTSMQFSR